MSARDYYDIYKAFTPEEELRSLTNKTMDSLYSAHRGGTPSHPPPQWNNAPSPAGQPQHSPYSAPAYPPQAQYLQSARSIQGHDGGRPSSAMSQNSYYNQQHQQHQQQQYPYSPPPYPPPDQSRSPVPYAVNPTYAQQQQQPQHQQHQQQANYPPSPGFFQSPPVPAYQINSPTYQQQQQQSPLGTELSDAAGDTDRGLGASLLGGAGGVFAADQLGSGSKTQKVIGAIIGAVAANMLEDKVQAHGGLHMPDFNMPHLGGTKEDAQLQQQQNNYNNNNNNNCQQQQQQPQQPQQQGGGGGGGSWFHSNPTIESPPSPQPLASTDSPGKPLALPASSVSPPRWSLSSLLSRRKSDDSKVSAGKDTKSSGSEQRDIREVDSEEGDEDEEVTISLKKKKAKEKNKDKDKERRRKEKREEARANALMLTGPVDTVRARRPSKTSENPRRRRRTSAADSDGSDFSLSSLDDIFED